MRSLILFFVFLFALTPVTTSANYEQIELDDHTVEILFNSAILDVIEFQFSSEPRSTWYAAVIIQMRNLEDSPLMLNMFSTFLLQDENGVTYAPDPVKSVEYSNYLYNLDPKRDSAITTLLLPPTLIPMNPRAEMETVLVFRMPMGPRAFAVTDAKESFKIEVKSIDRIPT